MSKRSHRVKGGKIAVQVKKPKRVLVKCEHNRQRSKCTECGGAGICEHNHRRFTCKECGGAGICEHNHRRSQCKECGGASICEHNRVRSQCKECGGASICEHNHRRSQCISCHPERACAECKYQFVPRQYRFHPHCFTCYCVLNPDADIPRAYKTKEIHMRDAIKVRFPDEAWVFDRQVGGGSSRKRPDVRLERITYSLLAECDEHQHPTAQYPCENRRTMELFTDLGNRMLVEVRLNPDAYNGSDGVRHPSCFTPTSKGLRVNTVEWALRLEVR